MPSRATSSGGNQHHAGARVGLGFLDPRLAVDLNHVPEYTYRVYIMGSDGHVQGRVDLICNDEGQAIELAKQLVDGRDVELWQRDRQIRTFKAHAGGNKLVHSCRLCAWTSDSA